MARSTSVFRMAAEERSRGPTNRIALWMIVRRAQERAHSLNTWFLFVDSPMPATKHSSAFCWFPVKRSDRK